MKKEIDNFLLLTAKWSPRWFNKPKFHILLHLPEHVRRFGPAILFATESFESFNAVIRAKSVHSNRHAPSRDIARQFAQWNRVRHALSGGRIPLRSIQIDNKSTRPLLAEDIDLSAVRNADKLTSNRDEVVKAGQAGLWRLVSKGPRNIANSDAIVKSYLGLSQSNKLQPGSS